MRAPHAWVLHSSQKAKSGRMRWISPGPATRTPETDLIGVMRHESLRVTPIFSGPSRAKSFFCPRTFQPQ